MHIVHSLINYRRDGSPLALYGECKTRRVALVFDVRFQAFMLSVTDCRCRSRHLRRRDEVYLISLYILKTPYHIAIRALVALRCGMQNPMRAHYQRVIGIRIVVLVPHVDSMPIRIAKPVHIAQHTWQVVIAFCSRHFPPKPTYEIPTSHVNGALSFSVVERVV